jgi:hypothetical protein
MIGDMVSLVSVDSRIASICGNSKRYVEHLLIGSVVMSRRIPGFSQPDMIAVWKEFVQKTFVATKFRTTFNGKTRNVYRDDVNLIVLDELHGDLELLAMQKKPGPATHVGSQEIDIVTMPPNLKFERGKSIMKGKHVFILIGSF